VKITYLSLVTSLAGLASALVLSGCSANFGGGSSTAATTTAHIQGKVHGGQQALNGAHVYMYGASTAGYGGSGIAASTTNASTSLLTNTAGVTTVDGNGNYYVTTDVQGNFEIDVSFACTPGTQVYLYSTGGDPQLNGSGTSSGNNAAATLLAVVGNCASATPASAFPGVTFVTMNEVSTIAAAYALAGFTTDPLHIGAPSSVTGHSLSATGIANAFNNALNIVTQSTGLAPTVTTASGSIGTVPSAEINTLADILANCVNSTGVSATGCSTLFTNTKNSAGTQPTDTATAAINMAQNPAQNVTALFNTVPSAPPFTPTSSSLPDFTLSIRYGGGGAGGNPNGTNGPYLVAIDAAGNAWISNVAASGTNANSISKITPSAVESVITGTDFAEPVGIGIDLNGTAWIANEKPAGGDYYLISVQGSTSTNYALGGALNAPQPVAIDPDDNVWIGNTGGGNITKYVPGTNTSSVAGTVYTPQAIASTIDTTVNPASINEVITSNNNPSGLLLHEFEGSTLVEASSAVNATLTAPVFGVAVDQNFDIYVVNGGTSVAVVAPGLQTSVRTNLTSSNFSGARYIAFDGANNFFVANTTGSSITQWNRATGTFTNYTEGQFFSPDGIAVDGSGNVWVANNSNSTVTEVLGLATPVVTPLVASLKAPYTTPASKP
jgi:hypothetical protein